MKKALSIITSLSFLSPFIAFAQGPTAYEPLSNLVPFVYGLRNILANLIPILITIAIIIFFWGLIKYVRGQGKDHVTGRNTMIAGLVSLFIMVTLWGILQFAANALGVQGFNTGTPLIPPRVGN